LATDSAIPGALTSRVKQLWKIMYASEWQQRLFECVIF
jgi:hypothetical protein